MTPTLRQLADTIHSVWCFHDPCSEPHDLDWKAARLVVALIEEAA